MRTLLNDLKYAARIYIKRIDVTILAVLMLALGIGATSAAFSIINATLLTPLPYPESDKIVILWRQPPQGIDLGYKEIPWGLDSFHLIRQESTLFQDLGAFKAESINLTGSSEPVLLQCIRASAGFFETFGVKPERGRFFVSGEDLPGHAQVVVLSHQLWETHFSSNPGILGSSVNLDGTPHVVIGIMPASFSFPHGEEMPGSFSFPQRPDLWIPLAAPASQPANAPDDLAIIAHLRHDIKIVQAQNAMNILATRMDSQSRAKGWFTSRIISLKQQVQGDIRIPLLLIFAAVSTVLLIACSNVASLTLTRSTERKPEFTLRLAMGAKSGRIVQQLMAESLLLALVGGSFGILFAYVGIHFVKIFGPTNIPRLQEVTLDTTVLLFTAGISILCGVSFGLAPALNVIRNNIAESLKGQGSRSGGSATGFRFRNSLITCEVALAFVLVVAAGLMLRTFIYLSNVNGGFDTDRVISFKLSLPAANYSDLDHIVDAYRRVLQNLKFVSGIQSSGIIRTIPLTGVTEASPIRIPGRVVTSRKDRILANYNVASPGYFAAIGTPLLSGRDFRDTDLTDSMPVVIINDSMARRLWSNQDAIGKQIGLGSPSFPLMTVVGVVADVKHLSLRENPSPEMYVPYTQKPYPSISVMSVIIRTKVDPAFVMNGVREAIYSVDKDLPIADVATMMKIKNDSVAQSRFSMLLLAAFAALAMLLACIGMYGVTSYAVAQRTREIGIRMALGARRRTVFGMVLSSGICLAGFGIIIGFFVMLGIARLISSFLYGIHTTDPLVYVTVIFLLMGLVLLACYVPARRATDIDPIVVLRCE